MITKLLFLDFFPSSVTLGESGPPSSAPWFPFTLTLQPFGGRFQSLLSQSSSDSSTFVLPGIYWTLPLIGDADYLLQREVSPPYPWIMWIWIVLSTLTYTFPHFSFTDDSLHLPFLDSQNLSFSSALFLVSLTISMITVIFIQATSILYISCPTLSTELRITTESPYLGTSGTSYLAN